MVIRTTKQALKNVERLRKEIPTLIQPETYCFDMVVLADRIYELEAELKVKLAVSEIFLPASHMLVEH